MMALTVAAIGKPSRGKAPEDALVESYRKRINGLARRTSLGPAELVLVDERSGKGRSAEGTRLLDAAGDAALIALDERGTSLSSQALADQLAKWRDAGERRAAFLIGGADGHSEEVRRAARLVLGLGAMTWPHLLVRVMIFEQLYRASTLLAGHPYHRA